MQRSLYNCRREAMQRTQPVSTRENARLRRVEAVGEALVDRRDVSSFESIASLLGGPRGREQ
jgi:hypothetical protein